MTATPAWRTPVRWIDRWFTAPEPSAAGRMGIVRILFGLFYLWHLSIFDASIVAGMPAGYRTTKVLLFDGLSLDPSATALRATDSLLVAALVLLVFGLRVRTMTAIVLVLGVFREACISGIKIEHSNVFMVFYIPLFMVVAGRWGETHSLDAMLARRRGARTVDPSSDSWEHFLAARATLVMLTALFTTSTVLKVVRGGTWLHEHHLLANLMLRKGVELTKLGLPSNPVAPWIAHHGTAGALLQLSVIAFEGSFFLVLVSRELRSFYLATAMIFHAINALLMVVTFTPILIVYSLFVDWQGLLDRVRPRLPSLPRVPTTACVATAIVSAALFATSWRIGSYRIFDLDGILDWRTMWLPVLPFALAWSARSAARIVRTAGATLRRERVAAER